MAIARVGVIGGGQLAWMMKEAAELLGIDLLIQTPNREDPAVSIAKEVIFAPIDDAEATARLATRCDVITFENEFIDLEALQTLADRGVCFRPGLKALAPLLDKYHQRCYLQNLGLPVPRFVNWESPQKIESPFNFPVVLKTRRHGYDGRGTSIAIDPEELKTTWERLKTHPIILEEFVPFDCELAIMAARSLSNEIVLYPVAQTYQKEQICRWVIAPAPIPLQISSQVEQIARIVLEQLQVVGVFGIELFLDRHGQVLVNEIAPRNHNSGHYTIDACQTSQFEMLLRAVSELPLGSSALKCDRALMVNLLGYEHSGQDYRSKRERLAQIPGAIVHWYGKTESRPGRKLGHVSVLFFEKEMAPVLQLARQIESIWYG